jgi:hypothetical protein
MIVDLEGTAMTPSRERTNAALVDRFVRESHRRYFLLFFIDAADHRNDSIAVGAFCRVNFLTLRLGRSAVTAICSGVLTAAIRVVKVPERGGSVPYGTICPV